MEIDFEQVAPRFGSRARVAAGLLLMFAIGLVWQIFAEDPFTADHQRL